MRWGNWYKHDATRVVLTGRGTSVIATLDDLESPAHVAKFVEVHGDTLTARDVSALLTAANELVWLAFDFTGIGDWVDDAGVQRGHQESRVSARG